MIVTNKLNLIGHGRPWFDLEFLGTGSWSRTQTHFSVIFGIYVRKVRNLMMCVKCLIRSGPA